MMPLQTMIACKCPGCGLEIRVPARCAGMQTVCPKCSARQVVPRVTDPAPQIPLNSPAKPPSPLIAPAPALAAPQALDPAQGRVGVRGFAVNGAAIAAVATVCLVASVLAGRSGRPQPEPPTTGPATGAIEHPSVRLEDARDDAGAEISPPLQPGSTPAAETVAESKPSGFSRRLPAPHPPEELRNGLELLRTRLKSLGVGDPATEREAALVRLRMYRYLCGLSHAELVLDERLNEEAVAAAEICRRLGKLTHDPENPGMAPDDYARAYRGASSGNLASGISSLVRAVDGWMDDSDAANIDVLGHRRWCLFPPLQRLGFGRTEGWCAMWAHDSSGSEPCHLPAICYPPPGLVPIDMFRPNHAWSVSLNPRLFRRPRPGEIRVQVQDAKGVAIELENETLETKGYGIDNCIIFRPRDFATTVGARYAVTISGIHDHDERTGNLSYEVEFFAE